MAITIVPSNSTTKYDDSSKEIYIPKSKKKVWQFIGHTLGEIKHVTKSTRWKRAKWFDAVSRGSLEEIKEQVALGADVHVRNTNGETALHVAAEQGHETIVSFVLSRGAHVNALTYDGQTALSMACAKDRKNVVKILLEQDACVHIGATNASGFLPIHIAAMNGSLVLIQLLLQYGAHADQVSQPKLLTPLMLAAKVGAYKVVERLLDAGVDPDAEDRQGNTALHFVSSEGHAPTTYLLLTAGADPGMPNIHEETPIDVAIRHEHKHLVHLLKSNGINQESLNEDEIDHAFLHDTQLLAAIARNRPELTKVLVKNRMKYASYCTLGCVYEDQQLQMENLYQSIIEC